LTAGLVGAAMLRQESRQPMSARLATIDLGPDGGGVMREAVAFVGDDDAAFALETSSPDVAVKPLAAFTPGDLPIVRQHPFSAPNAGIRAQSYQRVWGAEAVLDATHRLTATGQFNADGLNLRVDNALGAAVRSPRLVWGTS